MSMMSTMDILILFALTKIYTFVKQALYFIDNNLALLSMFQAIAGGKEGNNFPKEFDPNSNFSITFPNQYLSISLLLGGTT